MIYPDGESYEKLYAAYMDGRTPGALVDLAGDVEGKVVWDLCCGTGRLARECLERGASGVIAVDESADMMKDFKTSDTMFGKGRLRTCVDDVLPWMEICGDEYPPDFVFCRQAVNYWLNESSAESLARVMPEGSIFVFNTFHSKPMRKPKTKEYMWDDRWFAETSWLVGDTVHHVQVRDGMEPHVTSFKYISPKEFNQILVPSFAIGVQREGNTSLYKCERKKDG